MVLQFNKLWLWSFVFLILISYNISLLAIEKTGPNVVLSEVSRATWVVDGKGTHVVYIFFDPNCPSCQILYKNLRGFVKSNQYQFRWIPVAIVNPTSLGKAAAILEADSPILALQKNEENYKFYSGGLDENIASSKTEKALAENEVLLNKLDIPVIPSMLFFDKNNKSILIQGALSPLALRKVFSRMQ